MTCRSPCLLAPIAIVCSPFPRMDRTDLIDSFGAWLHDKDALVRTAVVGMLDTISKMACEVLAVAAISKETRIASRSSEPKSADV